MKMSKKINLELMRVKEFVEEHARLQSVMEKVKETTGEFFFAFFIGFALLMSISLIYFSSEFWVFVVAGIFVVILSCLVAEVITTGALSYEGELMRGLGWDVKHLPIAVTGGETLVGRTYTIARIALILTLFLGCVSLAFGGFGQILNMESLLITSKTVLAIGLIILFSAIIVVEANLSEIKEGIIRRMGDHIL